MSSLVPHVVVQGESLATLALRHGFDMNVVWNDPANEKLRKLRKDPHVLAPLDVVYVPEPGERQWLAAKVGAVNSFVASPRIMHGSILCVGEDGEPLKGAAFVVHATNPPQTGTTTGDGVAEFTFPAHQQVVVIELTDLGRRIVARVAHLDPIDTPLGVEQRLRALGLVPELPFLPGEEWHAYLAEYAVIAGLRSFQKQQGIEATGVVDAATKDALVSAYGM